ncbi:hypothetical protein SNE40_009990 [Patella caerulea]
MVMDLLKEFERGHTGLKVIVYDITILDKTTIEKVLYKTYLAKKDPLLVILYLQTNKMFHLLEIASEFDLKSNKTTNYRTNVFWIICGRSIMKKTFMDTQLNQHNLTNIIILNCVNNVLYSLSVSGNSYKCIECLDLDISLKDPEHRFSKCQKSDLYPNSKFRLNGRHLIIGTMESQLMIREVDNDNNSVYKGFLADLAIMLSHEFNFTYTFVQPKDQIYGHKVNGTWRGLVGLLVRHEVDMVLADIADASDRREVVDFIYPPIIQYTLGILYKHGTETERKWVKVFSPLQKYVYVFYFGSVVFVALFLIVMDLLYASCVGEKIRELSYNSFSDLMISLLGIVSVRGVGIWPQHSPGRVVIAFFWMFCMIVTAVYIGNLSAKLTDTSVNQPFKSIEELMKLSDWKMGITGDNLAHKFISESKEESFVELWQKIRELNQTDSDVFHRDSSFHVNRVLTSYQYAYIVSNPQYYVSKTNDCSLNTVGNVLSGVNIAIAVTKNSYLKSDLQDAMGKYTDMGFLKGLRDELFRDKRPRSCGIKQALRPMRLDDLLGCGLIICIGVTMSLLAIIVELVVQRRHILGHFMKTKKTK